MARVRLRWEESGSESQMGRARMKPLRATASTTEVMLLVLAELIDSRSIVRFMGTSSGWQGTAASAPAERERALLFILFINMG